MNYSQHWPLHSFNKYVFITAMNYIYISSSENLRFKQDHDFATIGLILVGEKMLKK